MPTCPTCNTPITADDLASGTCPQCEATDANKRTVQSNFEPLCADRSNSVALPQFAEGGADVRATLASRLNVGDSAKERASHPRTDPANGDDITKPIDRELPASINFGPAAGDWPEDATLPIPPTPSPRAGAHTEESLHTLSSVPPAEEGTQGNERSLQTLESNPANVSPEAIAALWSETDSAPTSPRTTIRRNDELTGSPRDSRLIITSRAVAPTQSPRRSSADYELLETIGEGGVGVVYAARQASIDRTVAVKMLKTASSQKPGQREKFLSEAVVTGELNHPNIVPIYDLGTNESGALFYSMKRVQGTPWAAAMAKKSLQENLDILMKVADAVGFAHSRGVIHRDLKPENVMLGEYGEVLVMDWGLAIVTPQFRKVRTVVPSTSMGGTPAYMAPEMAVGPVSRITTASDVYLLGALLYEIITGSPPHSAKTVAACLLAAARNVLQTTVHRGELFDIAVRAMATRPEDRFASARDFQIAVRQYQSHSESLSLSSRADHELAMARQSGDYELFSRAVFGFQEAYALWHENPRAKRGISEAKFAYAETAVGKGDYDLAISLLDPTDHSHSALIASVAAAHEERSLRQQRLKSAKRIATALAAAMLIVVTVALVWVSHLYGVAEQETQIAIDQKDKADFAKNAALHSEQVAKQERTKAEHAKSEEEYAAYIAKIGLAAAKVEENAFGEVDQLLDGCPPRLRNWEWGRLKFLCGRALRTFNDKGPLESVAFVRDGTRFVTGGADGVIRVWAIDNNRAPLIALDYGDPSVSAVAFAPHGQHVAAAGNDRRGGFVKIWNVSTGKPECVLNGHTDRVLSVVYNASGTRLLTTSCDATARLWDAQSGELLRTFKGHTWWVWSASFSPTEDAIVTAGQDRKCIVWRLDEPNESIDPKELRIFTGHAGPVYSAVFSPDGEYVVSGGYGNSLLIWRREEAKVFPYDSLTQGTKTAAPVYKTLEGHTAAVRSIRFTNHGRPRIVSASQDNTIRVWDFETASLIQTLRGHAGWVRGCDIGADARLIVSASHDHTAKLWSLDGYEEVRVLNARVLSGHSDVITCATFSGDGDQILTSSRDRTARIWSFKSGEMVRPYSEGHDYLASHAILFHDGRRFLTSGIDNTVRVWDIAAGTQVRLMTGTGASALVALSRDDRWILTASGQDGLLWDVDSGKMVRKFAGHHGEITAIAFSPDDRYVFTADATGRTRLWNRATGDTVWSQRAHSAGVNGAVFTPDGGRVLTASSDNTVGQFDVRTGKDLVQESLKHTAPVLAVAITADGRHVVTNAGDGIVRIWNLAQRRVEHVLEGIAGRASTLQVADQGTQLVTVVPSGGGQSASEQPSVIQFWDIESGQEFAPSAMRVRQVWSAAFAPHDGEVLLVGGDRASLWPIGGDRPVMSFSPHGAVTSAHYSPDERQIVTSGGDSSVKVWDVASGTALFKIAGAHLGPINSAVYSPDGKFILTASDDRTARLWDAATGTLIRGYTGHAEAVRSALFSMDGARIVTASKDGTARVWRTSGELLFSIRGHRSALVCAAFSRDGNRIVTGSEDNTARIWDGRTGQPIGELAGHTAAVTSACFSPDDKRILTGSQDSTAKLWDAQTSKEILTLKGHRGEVTSVTFSKDGRYALTGSGDGTAIVWLAEEWRNPANIRGIKGTQPGTESLTVH